MIVWARDVETPAFVLDERAVRRALARVEDIRQETGARVLYALKPLAQREVLGWMRGHTDGFAASSLFEVRLAREVLGDEGIVAMTTPGFREAEIERLAELCDHVALNSLSQWGRFRSRMRGRTSIGLRVNPGLSFVEDARYDPCRPQSKLGIPIAALARVVDEAPERLVGVEGLHFHSNCHSESFEPLLQTVRLLVEQLDPLLPSLRWINLGGGYDFARTEEFGPLYEGVRLLRERSAAAVVLEPGAALVREAGCLVATVTDLFEADGATIAVLDTTVNHAPEVFEYQFEPEVVGHATRHPCACVLAGASCLAGDLFGEYRFAEPLEIGSRMVFPNMGAYAFVKAHMFNGINLPNVYTISASGGIHLRRRFEYQDYLARLGDG
jgi:carboxynorspermidine decarboxylase